MSDATIRKRERLASMDPIEAARFLHYSQRHCPCRGSGWLAPWERCVTRCPVNIDEASLWMSETKVTDSPKRWLQISLATGPTDRELARVGISAAYRSLGLKEPSKWIWLDSPLQGAILAAMLANDSDEEICVKFRHQITTIKNSVNSVNESIFDDIQAAQTLIRDILRLDDHVLFLTAVPAKTLSKVATKVLKQVKMKLTKPKVGMHELVVRQALQARYGSFDSFNLVGHEMLLQCELLGHILAAQATGWWWPFKEVVIVTERPNLITPQAIIYPDDWRIKRWHPGGDV